jgi:transposase-like protein
MSGLNIRQLMTASEQDVRELFCQVRWADTGGKPVCPRCECDEVYTYTTRKLFKCKACSHQFSVTSGTVFASTKMPLRAAALLVVTFCHAKKGVSSLQLSRNIGVQQKTAFVFLHKLRDAIEREVSQIQLSGVVEIDGATFGGYRLAENYVKGGFEKRRYYKKFNNRHVVVVARQRFGRTVPFIVKKESDALPILRSVLQKGTVIVADGARAWNGLRELFDMLRINHDYAYSANNACTNMAESYFSVLRRMHVGVHHKISKEHMRSYASEIAWKQDFRDLHHDQLCFALLSLLLRSPVSRKWKGYSQRSTTDLRGAA